MGELVLFLRLLHLVTIRKMHLVFLTANPVAWHMHLDNPQGTVLPLLLFHIKGFHPQDDLEFNMKLWLWNPWFYVSSLQEAREFATTKGLWYMETSAKSNHQVTELFTMVGKFNSEHNPDLLSHQEGWYSVRWIQGWCCCTPLGKRKVFPFSGVGLQEPQ